jgi:hypothetical protein
VFWSRVLKKIFGLQIEEILGYWNRHYSEELQSIFASSHTINAVKSRTMKLAGSEESIGVKRY